MSKSEWVLPVLPSKNPGDIQAAVEVCRPDFIRAESAEDVVQCVRFHSRSRLVFEGVDAADIWRAIQSDRIKHPAAWASWRRYWDGVEAQARVAAADRNSAALIGSPP